MRYLSFTLRVYQSVAEGAAQCCDSDLQWVGLLYQQRWQLVHHHALSHQLYWVNRASQDGSSFHDKFISWGSSGPQECLTWASSADGVCSDLSCMLLQCQPSPVYYSGELPGPCEMSPSQNPFPGCYPLCRVVCACFCSWSMLLCPT